MMRHVNYVRVILRAFFSFLGISGKKWTGMSSRKVLHVLTRNARRTHFLRWLFEIVLEDTGFS